MVEQGLARIRKILTENYVRPDESERIKSKIWELRQYTIIDKVSVRFDEYRGNPCRHVRQPEHRSRRHAGRLRTQLPEDAVRRHVVHSKDGILSAR